MRSLLISVVIVTFIATIHSNSQDREIGNSRAAMTTMLSGGTPSVSFPTLFESRTFPILGWNWDNPISRFNDLVTGYTIHVGYRWQWTNNFGLLPTMGTRMRDSSTDDPNQMIWLYPHVEGTDGILAIHSAGGLEEVKCIRYDPEIDVQLSSFTPDANASPGATFGFKYRHPDLTPINTGVDMIATDFPDDDTTLVLAEAWPDSAMFQRFQNDVFDPPNESPHLSGREMLLSVNLHRISGATDIPPIQLSVRSIN